MFAVFPAISVVLGALVTFVRTPSAKLRSAVQHMAAGVIFCVLATELLPDLVHRHMPWATLMGFSIGVAVMLAFKWAGDQGEKGESARSSRGLLSAMGVDVALDGMLIGLSFAAGERQGLLLTIALVLELFFSVSLAPRRLAVEGKPSGRSDWCALGSLWRCSPVRVPVRSYSAASGQSMLMDCWPSA